MNITLSHQELKKIFNAVSGHYCARNVEAAKAAMRIPIHSMDPAGEILRALKIWDAANPPPTLSSLLEDLAHGQQG